MHRKRHATILRVVRKIHRTMGIFLFIFYLVIGTTGVLLGLKKNFNSLQVPTQTGTSADPAHWLPMDSLIALAEQDLISRNGTSISTVLDKLDVRPDKGIVKVIYKNHYESLQIDATTGVVLSREFRVSDFIEHVHDGTIVDNVFGLPGGIFKIFYTTILGTALVSFSLTGFWLWYGPKLMRRKYGR